MFCSRDYWEDRYSNGGNSGSGSYGRLAEFKAKIINEFCRDYSIKKIVEWGCGDGNNCAMYDVEEYVGYDVSKTAIDICKKRFPDSGKQFVWYDGEIVKTPIEGRLTLSLDVLYHLIEPQIYDNYMHNLFGSSTKYVGIYSYDGSLKTAQSQHVKYREHSNYVKNHFPQFQPFKTILNEYKRTESTDPDTTSYCDFFFYKRRE